MKSSSCASPPAAALDKALNDSFSAESSPLNDFDEFSDIAFYVWLNHDRVFSFCVLQFPVLTRWWRGEHHAMSLDNADSSVAEGLGVRRAISTGCLPKRSQDPSEFHWIPDENH